MRPFYVLQQYNNGIGNFINCTPTIIGLYKRFAARVPVLFQRSEIADMFLECPYIEFISDVEGREMVLSSSFVNQDIPDWLYLYHCTVGFTTNDFSAQRDIPHTYVDRVDKPNEIPNKPFVAFLRGCFADNQYYFKDPGVEAYRMAIDSVVSAGLMPVFLGNSKDYDRGIRELLEGVNDYTVVLDDVRKSLGAIRTAEFVVSNDTGFYHAAAALKKPTFVFWKDTNWEKNRAPGNTVRYSFKNRWGEDWREWIESRQSSVTCQ